MRLPVIIRKDSIELFTQVQGLQRAASCKAGSRSSSENYVKTVNIEGQLTSMMAQDDDPAGGAALPGARWPTR